MEELELSYIVGRNINGSATLGKVPALSYQANDICPYNSKIPLLGIYQRKMKIHDHKKDLCGPIYIKQTENLAHGPDFAEPYPTAMDFKRYYYNHLEGFVKYKWLHPTPRASDS